jgi:hypothetical protein
MRLATVLADLRAAGVAEAKVERDENGYRIHVVFGASVVPVRPVGLLGRDGEPLNLDEGLGALEVDPLEEAERQAEAAGGDPLHAKNFPPKVKAHAAE